MAWLALQSISLRFKFQQPRLRQLDGHDQLLHLHENWTQRLQRLILDMCSAQTCFLPCFPLACLLNLILSFLIASFILLSFFVSLFFPFVLVQRSVLRFLLFLQRLYEILLHFFSHLFTLLLRVLGACLSFLFSLFTRAPSHGLTYFDRSSQQASAAFSLFDVFMEWRASHDHENTIASSATRIRPKEVKCDAV